MSKQRERIRQDPLERLIGAALGNDRIAKRVLPPALLAGEQVQATLVGDEHDFGTVPTAKDIAPIWVLAAGWGSGSTLVQRLLISSGKALIWGEPLDRVVPIPHLAAPIAGLQPDWPPPEHFQSAPSLRALANAWVANLVPPLGALREAQRAWMTAWLQPSAQSLAVASDAITSFGLKEVRLCAGYGHFLKWLFPASKIVFVVRHPYDCWRSCKGVDWYSVWPRYRVAKRLAFAHHWRHLTRSFLAEAQRLDALLLPYESLHLAGQGLRRLEAYADIGPLDATVLKQRIGARAGTKLALGGLERKLIAGVCGPQMQALGYSL
ncbi:MAG: sulfotransferase [Pseudomonadota bacterium]